MKSLLAFKLLWKLTVVLVITVLIGGWFYWFQWRPILYKRKVLTIKRVCEEKVYNRPNELNYEWAEGKEWMPLPNESFTGTYGWLYTDQHDGLKTKVKNPLFAECLKKNNIELYVQLEKK